MGTTEGENLSRKLLGLSAQLFLYNTSPEKYKDKINNLQASLGNIVFGLSNLGLEKRTLQFVGPLSFALLRPLITPGTELADYLDKISTVEPEKEKLMFPELIASFDNIIILLGKKSSGKGTISQILNEDYGFPSMPTADWLRAIAAARGLPEPFDPVMLRELGDELRQEFGGGILVRLTLQRFFLEKQKNVVFDGLRVEEEMWELIGKPNVTLVWVEAPNETRLERVKNRNRPGDPQTIEELLEVDSKSLPEADKLREMCQVALENSKDDINALRQKVNELMAQLRLEKLKK